MALTFNQCAALLNNINKQVTGQTPISIIDENGFISVANTLLEYKTDELMGAITQEVFATIFSVRPYKRKFEKLHSSMQEYGNHVRKISYIEEDAENNTAKTMGNIADGQSVDHYRISKPKAIQMVFSDFTAHQRRMTTFESALKEAFRSSSAFGSFIAGRVTHVSNMIEQDYESMARACVANMIAAKSKGDPNNVIHLLSEYKTESGIELTATTVNAPENFAPFMRWAISRIQSISDMFTERSVKYHIGITGKPIARHTPIERQRLYMYAPLMRKTETTVMSTTFNNEYLKLMDFERVNFWQSIDSPDTINVKPVYIDANGARVVSDTAVKVDNIAGILCDYEAMGMTVNEQRVATTPLNAEGLFYNTIWHYSTRYWNDLTENAVVFMLD